jgi:hypothetical protein
MRADKVQVILEELLKEVNQLSKEKKAEVIVDNLQKKDLSMITETIGLNHQEVLEQLGALKREGGKESRSFSPFYLKVYALITSFLVVLLLLLSTYFLHENSINEAYYYKFQFALLFNKDVAKVEEKFDVHALKIRAMVDEKLSENTVSK